MDERAERPGLGRLHVVREWWWAVLPAVVAISIAVSSLGGTHRSDARPPVAAAVTQAPSGIFQTVVPLDGGHRLAVGHRRPSPFRRCVASHDDMTTRQAQRTCLTEAHLGISTPFS